MDARVDSWLERYRGLHLGIMAPVTLAITTVFVAGSPLSDRQSLLVLAAAVAVFGLPHGALDHLSGRRLLEPRFGSGWIVAFAAGYLALAALVGVIWWQAPQLALGAFLLYSAWHFGAGDAGGSSSAWESLARGSMPILLPAAFHGDRVTTYFNWLLPSGDALAPELVTWSAIALSACAALTLVVAFTARATGAENSIAAPVLELAALALLFAIAPPLISFLIYFCGWHSIRHLFDLGAQLAPDDPSRAARHLARSAWPLTLVAVAAAWPAWWLLRMAGLEGEAALARVLFVGLAALTVPHMMLGWLATRQPVEERTST